MTNEGPDIVLHYVRTARTGPCPGCGQRSQRIQSDYQRVVAELPWRRTTVRIRLDVRRFWCMNLACGYQIFLQTVGALVAGLWPAFSRFDRVDSRLGVARKCRGTSPFGLTRRGLRQCGHHSPSFADGAGSGSDPASNRGD